MKCKNCELWKAAGEYADYGSCKYPENLAEDGTKLAKKVYIATYNFYHATLITHKNHCCASFVAAKITKE